MMIDHIRFKEVKWFTIKHASILLYLQPVGHKKKNKVKNKPSFLGNLCYFFKIKNYKIIINTVKERNFSPQANSSSTMKIIISQIHISFWLLLKC